jgi:shikimate kinase
MIAELCQMDGVVIATGGGAVLRDANRKSLRSGGQVVYLFTSIEQQLGRTSRDRNRPLLQRGDPEKVLIDLMSVRDPLYREIADLIIETDERPPRMVVQEILERLPVP